MAAACGLWACDSGERGRLPTAAAPAPSAPSDDATKWEQVTLEDEVPLCVFADHDERRDALFLGDVRKQKLRPNSRVVFGTFPPACQNEACDAAPTHQCWVDSEERHTLVVHSRLSFEHKRGTVCTTNCRPVIAGCETEVLRAGKYTVKYGRRTFDLRVPSVLHAPCFDLK